MEDLGCAVNPDGTLKDASEICWAHSRSASPELSSMSELALLVQSVPLPLVRQAPNDEEAPCGKQPVKRVKVNPWWPLSTVQPQPKMQVNLSYHEKSQILEFADGAGQGLSQSAIAQHFHNRWPSLRQDSISKILKDQATIERY